MQWREKILLGGLLAALVLWQIAPAVQRMLFGPLEERRATLQGLAAKLQQKDEQELAILRAKARLRDSKALSLPPDELDAQRLYLQWLTDLAQIAGFGDLKVSPGRVIKQGKTYVAVPVEVGGTATLDQVVAFLYHFHRTALLHRVVQLSADSPASEGNPRLKVSLTAEGLSLQDAARRERLFPETELTSAVSNSATQLTVGDATAFPSTPGFRVRLGNEYMIVTQRSGKEWTVKRGVDATTASAHTAGERIELAPVNPEMADRTLEDYRTLVARSPFTKPAPVTAPAEPNRAPTVAQVAPRTVYLGQTLTLPIEASDDGPKEQLSYRLGDGAPEGASIDARTGELRWTPSASLEPKEYQLTVVVTDGKTPPLSASQTVRVTVREDSAAFTFLVASVARDEQSEAWLYDRSSNRRMVLSNGSKFQVADISATVREIGRDFVLLESNGGIWRLGLGDNLRAMTPMSDAEVAAPAAETSRGGDEASLPQRRSAG